MALIAFGLGLLLLLLSLQFAQQATVFFANTLSEDNTSEYLIINKKIGILNNLNPEASAFKEYEVADLKKEPFIKEIQSVKANTFKTNAEVRIGSAVFGSELFFESVPDAFLGRLPSAWKWQQPQTGDYDSSGTALQADRQAASTVPVLISRDFLAMYNLGFANTRGLPVLPEETLGLIPLSLRISNQDRYLDLPARIVGVTSKISSILIPQEVMDWANRDYGRKRLSGDPRRLIVKVSDPRSTELEKFLRKKQYEVSDASKGLRETAYLVNTVLSVLASIGAIMLALAVLIFFLNLQLFVSNSRQDIDLLVLMGYRSTFLAFLSSASAALGIVIVSALALVATIFINHSFGEFMRSKSLDFSTGIGFNVVIVGLLGPVLLLLTQYFWLRFRFRRLSLG